MRRAGFINLRVALAAAFFSYFPLSAAEWQFSARDVHYDNATGTARTIDAFLWIPPGCEHVRGVLLAQQGVVEQQVMESTPMRQAAESSGAAIVFLTPGMEIDLGAERSIATLNKVMAALAQSSGYAEIATAPWLPFGHSTNGVWALRLGAAAPGRAIAVISFKGQLPLPELAAVPVLTTHGEYYEWMKPGDRNVNRQSGLPGLIKGLSGVRRRFHGPHALLIDPDHSHFDCQEALTRFLALYVSKSFAFRLPKVPGSDLLQPAKPEDGWLTDQSFPRPVHVKTAPAITYEGEASDASWYFDQELAQAAERLQVPGEGRTDQMTTFLDASGAALPLSPRGLIEPLTPEFEDDGITFTVRPGFFAGVPSPLLHEGEPLSHSPTPPQAIKLNGHFAALGANRFRMEPDFTWPHIGGGYYVLAVHPGDARFRAAVQPGLLPPFEKNTTGLAQRITFPPVSDCAAGTPWVDLAATSDSGLPVSYYVRQGPAHFEGSRLIFSPLPPRSRFPVQVTVVAWQWGRRREPQVRTAEFVERTFAIVR